MRIIHKHLTPNSYSRPKTKVKKIKGIVIHWVGNKDSTAIANRNFFQNGSVKNFVFLDILSRKINH